MQMFSRELSRIFVRARAKSVSNGLSRYANGPREARKRNETLAVDDFELRFVTVAGFYLCVVGAAV